MNLRCVCKVDRRLVAGQPLRPMMIFRGESFVLRQIGRLLDVYYSYDRRRISTGTSFTCQRGASVKVRSQGIPAVSIALMSCILDLLYLHAIETLLCCRTECMHSRYSHDLEAIGAVKAATNYKLLESSSEASVQDPSHCYGCR